MKRVVKLILILVGIVAVLKYSAIALISLVDDADDDLSVRQYSSPDGRYIAAHVMRSGGGAIASFCSDRVLVFNSSLSVDEVVKHSGYLVYSGECDSFAEKETSPDVHWESERNLHIDFSIAGTQARSRKVDLKAYDASGVVRVGFSAYR
ncbi:hypothetical protein AB3464_04525 [Pseudomonas asplenii]|uniref:hypothetical protein n=1 Tax=Pseudomonas asplenii TaxID=53407 RepID=UPI00223497EB|nr:hypothetical protein [Pseudomonas asplenii]UZE27120.1 hypothetical protein LOY63_17225 [Pseudomonas asplenii]